MRAAACLLCLTLITGCQPAPAGSPPASDSSSALDGLVDLHGAPEPDSTRPSTLVLRDAVPPPATLMLSPHQLRPRPPSPTRIWLNTDGATITKGPASDASILLSYICGGTFPPFKHATYGTDRSKVVAQLASRVAAYLAPYDVEVVTSKPATIPYEMVLVGGAASLCGQAKGVAGLAPLDCADKVPGEIAFVFSDDLSDLGWLGLTAAHEVAHTLGLLHTGQACDVMAPLICAPAKKAFMDGNLPIWPDHQGMCGQQQITNSHRALGLAVGLK